MTVCPFWCVGSPEVVQKWDAEISAVLKAALQEQNVTFVWDLFLLPALTWGTSSQTISPRR